MILILGHLTNPVALFLLGAIVACVLEYLTSYGMDILSTVYYSEICIVPSSSEALTGHG